MSYLAYSMDENSEQMVDISTDLAVIDWEPEYAILWILSEKGRDVIDEFYDSNEPGILVYGPQGNQPDSTMRIAKFNFKNLNAPTALLLRTGSEKIGKF